MSISSNTQAILLLTAHFSKTKDGAAKPLTPKEWGRFAFWLKEKSLTPECLITGRPDEFLKGWNDKTVTPQRIEELINRGSALAFSMEKWLRSGLWVMTRSDGDYPQRLKKRLSTDSPAVLFGCGNRSLLNGGGLAVVGSRHTSENDLAYSQDLGKLAAENGYSIVSGGAKGVDESAMMGALEVEGTVIGVIANDLLRVATNAKYRSYLMANNLVLLSPFYPEAGFNIGNAMQRNKYIYCLSDAAVVVHSGTKGGTWSGAHEALKKRWVTIWVKETKDKKAGNSVIIEEGGRCLPSNIDAIDFLNIFKEVKEKPEVNNDLFEKPNVFTTQELIAAEPESDVASEVQSDSGPSLKFNLEIQGDDPTANSESNIGQISFYEFFLTTIEPICSDGPKTTEELMKLLSLNKTQLNTWLKQAVAEKKIRKLSKPVRYEWGVSHQGSLSL
jgi:predicted Rossmann fold nucleotide-binding protein DprA/Smf involved in DNA uptake